MKEYFNTKVKPLLIKIKDYIYEDYGIKPETIDKFVATLCNIVKLIFIVIMIPLTIVGLMGSLFMLSLVYPLVIILYLLISIIFILYALFRDKLDEKYQIL